MIMTVDSALGSHVLQLGERQIGSEMNMSVQNIMSTRESRRA